MHGAAVRVQYASTPFPGAHTTDDSTDKKSSSVLVFSVMSLIRLRLTLKSRSVSLLRLNCGVE